MIDKVGILHKLGELADLPNMDNPKLKEIITDWFMECYGDDWETQYNAFNDEINNSDD